jgi:glycosyltransferase involved in cell wall biosynthesis
MNISVSVVIPCYNAEAYVADAVRSALAQTHPPLEIICVDDGSSDHTLHILRELGRGNPGLIKIIEGENEGAPVARNKGLREASGEYVEFLDSDDIMIPDKFEHQISIIESCDSLPDLLCSVSEKRDFDKPEGGVVTDLATDLWCGLLESRLGFTSANLWRRTAVEKVGGWDETLRSSQEADLMFRMIARGASVALDPMRDPLTVQRRRPTSVWNDNYERSLTGWLELRGRIIQHLYSTGQMTPERQSSADISVFRRIRDLYRHAPRKAIKFHSNLVSPDFDPKIDHLGRIYARVYKTLGFAWAERYYLLRNL